MSLTKNFIFNSAYRLLLVVTPLITTPYLSRILGAEGVGVFSYTYSITEYFVLFAALGMSTYGVRAVAMAKAKDRIGLSRLFSGIFYSQIIISLGVIAVYLGFATLFYSEGMSLLGILWVFWVISAALDVSWLYFGLEEFKLPTIRSVVIKIVELICIFVFVKSAHDLWIYVLIISVGCLLTQGSLWFFLKRYVALQKVPLSEITRHFKPNLILFLPVIAVGILTTMDRIILGLFSTMSQVGYFDYSEKICKMPKAIITALGIVMLPRMTSLFASGKMKEGFHLIEKSVWFMLGVSILMAFGIVAIAPEFAPVFLGEEFAECSSMITVLAIVIPISTLSNVAGKQILLPTMREKEYVRNVFMGIAANFIICMILVSTYGVYAACVASVIGEVVILVAHIYSVRSNIPIGSYIKQAAPFVPIGMMTLISVRLAVLLLGRTMGISVLLLFLEITVGLFVAVIISAVYFGATKNHHYSFVVGKIRDNIKR